MLTEILWELVFHSCLLSLVQFLLVPFQIQAFSPLALNDVLISNNSALVGKVVPQARVGQAVTVWCRLGTHLLWKEGKDSFWDIVWFLFILSFDLKLPLLLKVTNFEFQAPSMWKCLARFTHSQLTDIQIANKQILLCDAGTPDSCNYYAEMTFGK